jgi:hypothetical protein
VHILSAENQMLDDINDYDDEFPAPGTSYYNKGNIINL